MAQSRVGVNKSYADMAALKAWIDNLSADINAGRVLSFSLAAPQGGDDKIVGAVGISSTTSADDLSIDVED